MGVFSSGNKWKAAAQGALASASALEGQQKDIEFQRSLLSNIRQNRLARAQIELSSAGGDYTSSSTAGALGNLDSSLAGEMKYSYETSQRAADIQDYQQKAREYMQKYSSQQKTRAAAFSVAAIAGAVLTGGALGMAGIGAGASAASASAAAGGSALAQFGASAWASLGAYGSIAQGIGQIASGTGQTETGIGNIVSGIATNYKIGKYKELTADSIYS